MTEGSSVPYQHQPLFFLDTNAVHQVHLYIGFAEKHQFPPIGENSADPQEQLKKEFYGKSQTFHSFDHGRRLVNWLLEKQKSEVRIEYAPATRLELICGLLRGKAIQEAAIEGIPRLWTRMDAADLSRRLSLEQHEEILKEIENVETLLDRGGISLNETSPDRMSQVWQLAPLLLGKIFLDFGDSIIYASALLAEADELITTDGYFRGLVNAIENPDALPEAEEKNRFRTVRDEVRELISQAISISTSTVKLPKAPKT